MGSSTPWKAKILPSPTSLHHNPPRGFNWLVCFWEDTWPVWCSSLLGGFSWSFPCPFQFPEWLVYPHRTITKIVNATMTKYYVTINRLLVLMWFLSVIVKHAFHCVRFGLYNVKIGSFVTITKFSYIVYIIKKVYNYR